jgi:hypothetical protein
LSLSIHDVSVPVFVRALGNLSAILDKAVEHAKANGLDEAELINARLAPDMLTLAGQIQRVSDTAKGAGARLSASENPSFADTETTFPDLQARIARTVDYLNSLPVAAFDGARDVTIPIRRQPTTMSGQAYLLTFALPNFFFHVTTAYDILRHKGVGVGKMDYLGNF